MLKDGVEGSFVINSGYSDNTTLLRRIDGANSLKSLESICNEIDRAYYTHAFHADSVHRSRFSVADIEIQIGNYSNTVSFYDLFVKDDCLEKVVSEYQGIQPTATPYITKVVNHWYRNQYFISEEQGVEQYKQRLRTMKVKIVSYINGSDDGTGNADDGRTININYEEINNITTKEQAENYIEEQRAIYNNDWTLNVKIKQKITNEINAARDDINSEISGIAYDISSNIDPYYYKIINPEELSKNDKVQELLRHIYVKETRDKDIVQVHNPLFEDNSQYIRKLLKEQYYIYGENTENKIQKNEAGIREGSGIVESEGETTQTILSDAKAEAGKGYIQQKQALEHITAQIEQCTGDRQDEIYMYRDLKELFEDFEFDFENTEKPAQKILDNIMPDYNPYTSWPSEYEKTETNCTKMIYKTFYPTTLKAPANGKITRIQDNIIEITFTDDIETNMTLYVEVETGTLIPNVEKGATVIKGDTELATVRPEIVTTTGGQGPMIVLKLRLFSDTKQILKVEDYMTVENHSYEDLETTEINALYALQLSEIGQLRADESNETLSQRYAIVNVVFNKIASPYYPQYLNILTTCTVQADFLKYEADSVRTIQSPLINTKNLASPIRMALMGGDTTKTFTLIGATRYFAMNDEYYQGMDTLKKEQRLEEANAMKIKMQIGNRVYGITEEEYQNYLGDMLGKKLDEVIYQLNIAHNEAGTEDKEKNYLEFKDKFNTVKEIIINKYTNSEEDILQQCSPTTILEADKMITNVVKSNIVAGEPDANGQVTDEFLLTINSNYMVKWIITYTLGEGGKIEGEIGENNIRYIPILNY